MAENAVLQATSPDNYHREALEEVDFLITLDGKVITIEVKYGALEHDSIIYQAKNSSLPME